MLRKLKNLFNNNKVNQILKYSLIKYIALAIGFIKGIVNAKVLGPEFLGILGNLLLVLSYLSYANLGILYSMNREYVLYRDKNTKKSKEVLYSAFTFLSILSMIFIICGFIFQKTNIKGIAGTYLIYVFFIAIFEQFKMFYINYFRLIDNFRKINIIELINNVGAFLLILIFIKYYKIYAVLYSMLICGFITFIYGLFSFKEVRLKINFKILNDLFVIGIPLLIYNLGFYLLTTVGRVMIIKYLNYELLGYYTFANDIVNATLVFISSILFLYYPKAIKALNINENFNKEKIYINTRQLTKYVELIGVFLCVIGMIFIKPFVNIIAQNYETSIQIYRILIVGTIATQVVYFANVFIVSNKKQIYLVWLQIITILISIISSYIFLKLGLGIIGIAIATTFTNIIYSIIQYIIFLKILRYSKNCFKVVVKTFYKFILFTCIITIISILNLNNFIYIIALLVTLFILYKRDITNVVSSFIKGEVKLNF